MDFTDSFPAKNIIHWDIGKCWVYAGMKKFDVAKDYQCGVLWRFMCWIKNAGVKFELTTPVKTCRFRIGLFRDKQK